MLHPAHRYYIPFSSFCVIYVNDANYEIKICQPTL